MTDKELELVHSIKLSIASLIINADDGVVLDIIKKVTDKEQDNEQTNNSNVCR